MYQPKATPVAPLGLEGIGLPMCYTPITPLGLCRSGKMTDLRGWEVSRFSDIDSAVSRYESQPTLAQQIDNYPGGLEHKERRSPFPTNDSVLCRGRGFRRKQRSLFPPTSAKCQHALVTCIMTMDNRRCGSVYKVSPPCFQPPDSLVYCLPISTTSPLADTLLQRRFYKLHSTSVHQFPVGDTSP